MNTKGKKPKRKVKMDYGDGSIYFVKSRNCYAGQVYLEIDGEKIRKSVYGKTERIVKDKIRELQIQAKAGAFKKVDKTTFYELAEKMIEEQIDLNEIRQSTYKRKLETLKMLDPLSDKQLRKITEDDIVAYFKDNLDYAQSTLNKLYQLLGAVFKKAIKKGIIDKSPLEDLRVPKSRKKTDKVRALTVEEQARLLDVLNNNDINYSEIMLVSMFTGMRGGEICALNIEDIDFQNSCIIVNKTTSRGGDNAVIVNETKTEAGMRRVLINNELAAFLKECIGERTGGTLFVSSNNKPVTTQQVKEVLTRTFSSHDLSLSARNLLHDRENPVDLYLTIDREAVTATLKSMLDILDKEEQKVEIDETHAAQIKEYLTMLDLLMEVDLRYLPHVNRHDSITVITQPGLRYAQATALVNSMLLDEQFSALSAVERSRILERILSEIKGRMMEDIVLLETKLSNPDKEVFQLQFAVGEFDMVVADAETLTCEIFEIKYSQEVVPAQYRHLTDAEKCAQTEHRYGTITSRTVIYRGETTESDNVKYINVEEYLNLLGQKK